MMIAKIINKNTINIYDITQFDLDAIMHSGQVFRYFKTKNGYDIVSGVEYASLYREDNKIIIICSDAEYFFNYFDLHRDYNQIKYSFNKIKDLQNVISLSGGIRILNADFFEIVLSFIISANNNIKRFTKTLNLLAEKYGDKLDNGLFSFPTLKQLSKTTEEDFKIIGCGYRSPYLVKAVEQLSNINLSNIAALSNNDLSKELCKISGVGPKVSACIMLFSKIFHRLDIAPIDTWLNKVLCDINEPNLLLNNKYAGVLQQYLFYYYQYLSKTL